MNIKITSDGTSPGTKVTDSNGEPIQGIVALNWRMAVHEISRADVELSFVTVERIDAEATMYGPGGKEVRRIEYADGTFDEYPEAA